MKKISIYVFIVFAFYAGTIIGHNAGGEDFSFEISGCKGKSPTKMHLLIGVVGNDPSLQTIAEILSEDFSCSKQQKTGFEVSTRSFKKIPSKNEIYQLFVQEGYPLIVFLNASGVNAFEWRLYDALQTMMLKGSRVAYQPKKMENTVHACADVVWKELTGQEGIFSTVIAYCRQQGEGRKQVRHIYSTSPSSREARCLVDTASNKLALRWHSSSKEPVLFYSEHTPVNVRLVSTSFAQDETNNGLKLVANLNGLNMQPSFASDGTRSVMCASCLGSSQLFYGVLQDNNQWQFKRITYNNGNNIAPILRDSGDIIFCSDFELNRPQIYCYHSQTKEIERLTSGGYSASPAWCEQKEMLAYTKSVNGVMQIFTYNWKTKEHVQITHDGSHKEEPTWSPEGSYLAYSVEKGAANRIAVRNLITNEEFYLTGAQEYCCYPAWSPRITV